MFSIPTLLVLVPALPLAATLVTAALGKRVLRERSHVPVIVALGAAFLASVALLGMVYHEASSHSSASAETATGQRIGYESPPVTLWTWADVPHAYTLGSAPRDFHIDVVLRADPLTAVMLTVVTFVSLLVAIYSVGYMHHDPGYWRFFTYIALFVFSMTMLVSVSNFVLLYVFWEAVGLCSYLLIGFWFQKPEAAAAGKKAFLVNRVGDFGFALGIFLIWTTYGTLDFHDTWVGSAVHQGVLGQVRLHDGSFVGGTIGTAICLLLMLGACGKSAQIPLHVWLPDAMEGPTPVSALIHAATMVTAGVYMVARTAPLYAVSASALEVVALIGGATAAMAAIVAVTQTDLKRILAYSTISQLGYMFLGMGTGTFLGITAGMFHLVTHAFFKALLFLGAGSVMHAMGGVIDIRRFGGLKRVMPVTHATFFVGALGLAGVAPLAGFWSKDAILAAVHGQAEHSSLYLVLYVAGLLVALLTAFYTFRAFFVTFYGPERIPHEAGHHAHESPRSMTGPLVVLAIATVVVGMLLEWNHLLSGFLAQTPSLAYVESLKPAPEEGFHWGVAAWSTLVAAVGIGLAWLLYLGAPGYLPRLSQAMQGVGLYGLSAGKFFFDLAYLMLVVWPLEGIARFSAWFDRTIIDGLVNRLGLVPAAFGAALRPLQAGLIPFYALAMLLGMLILLGALLI